MIEKVEKEKKERGREVDEESPNYFRFLSLCVHTSCLYELFLKSNVSLFYNLCFQKVQLHGSALKVPPVHVYCHGYTM